MRTLVTALVLLTASAVPALASPVQYGTFITLFDTGAKSQFTSPVDTDTETQNLASVYAEADLSQAKLRVSNVGNGTSTGAGSNTLIYDTLTFDASAFVGAFGSTYNLQLNAHYEGTFSHNGPLSSGFASGFLRAYSGATTIDSSVFDNLGNLVTFLTNTTSLCASSGFQNLATATGAFSFDVNCAVTVSAADPAVRILMNLGTGVNPGTSMTWNLDMLNSGTLSAPFGGREVTSASGAFPGTAQVVDATVPEPATVGLVGLGLALAAFRARRGRAAGR